MEDEKKKYPELPEGPLSDVDRKQGWGAFDTWCEVKKIKRKDRIKFWGCWQAAQSWDDRGQDW